MANRPNPSVLDASLKSLAIKQATPEIPTVPLDVLAAHVAADPMPSSPALVSAEVVVRLGREAQAAAWIEGQGGRLISTGEKVLLAELPPDVLGRLGDCPGIRRAEGSRHLLPRLDEARGPATGLDNALGTHSLTGQGVFVGIVDTGVDWTHPDFRDTSGSTRLELFAFANRPGGSQISSFQEFDAAAINAALEGGPALPQGDPQGHGTHCASIAVGNGFALNGASNRQFRGVAPDAALVAVRSEPLLDDHIIWGIRRTFDLARQSNRPAVVTLSLGGHLGPHDGTSAIENVIARESGPGRIVVVAAGNEGGDEGIHFQGTLASGSDFVITVRITDSRLVFADVWVPRNDEVDVWVEAPNGVRIEPTGETVSVGSSQVEAHWQEDLVNRDQNLTVFIAQGQVGSTWRIHIEAGTVVHGDIHAWAGTISANTSVNIFPGASAGGFSIGMPGTEERCIAVGSFVSRASLGDGGNGLVVGQLSPFSSLGPSRYGALKPDVAAPGQFITAALASGSQMASAPNLASRRHPSGKYITIQGTSMATPFVAGVIALMLQREPDLTPEEVHQRLRVTCRRDAQTGRVWHPGFGFGKIDVQSLLDYEG